MDFSLITDWLTREGGDLFTWWLLTTLAGAAVWPLLYRVMGGLPDRGYTLARPAGLMLAGFVFWFLGVTGFLHNTVGGMIFAWLVVVVIGLAAFFAWAERPPVRVWLREHLALIIVTEVLFAVLFLGWAAYRAHNPEMASTEKPMEVMFINSIRASETFPPRDAWLSGYAISYYYFGYVIIAMLADLGGVSTSIAFTMTIALIAALAGIGVLGVVYNLVRVGTNRRNPGTTSAALGAGVLGTAFLVLMGNLGTALVEFPYRGYAPEIASQAYFDFWDVPERAGTITVETLDGPIETVPDQDNDGIADWDDSRLPLDRWGFWGGLGWRYSRTINDRNLNGESTLEPIAEFPSFSFILGDLHPHVLALPFAVLAIGLALNLVLAGRDLARWEYPLYAIWVGGMVFVNSWDAVYLPLLIGAEALRRLIGRGLGVLTTDDLRKVGRFALILIGLTVVFYLPWIISFTSQAGGVLPNLIYPTRWSQFFLQFGTFLIILLVYLIVEARRARERFNWTAALWLVVGVLLMVALVLTVMALIAWSRDDVRHAVYSVWDTSGSSLGELAPDVLARRLIGLPTELLLLGFMALIVARLFARPPDRSIAQVDLDERMIGPDHVVRVRAINYSPATGFVLLLIGAAAVLTFAPDFVYLRDNFSVRINTVFKLYYQGWIMFSIASAFAVWSVVAGDPERGIYHLAGLVRGERVTVNDNADPRTDKPKRRGTVIRPVDVGVSLGQIVFLIVVVGLLLAGTLYTYYGARGRALIDTGRLATQRSIAACESDQDTATIDCGQLPPLTLDGAPTMIGRDEYAAVQCLADLATGGNAVLIEAPCHCGYHPEIGRFSALTGIPTLMGWGNHEGQWRGSSLPKLIDTRIENGQRRDRFTDVDDLYTTQDWAVAWRLIDRYSVDYIVVGQAERSRIRELAGEDASKLRDYMLGLQKFEQVLAPVCAFGETTVYRVAPQ